MKKYFLVFVIVPLAIQAGDAQKRISFSRQIGLDNNHLVFDPAPKIDDQLVFDPVPKIEDYLVFDPALKIDDHLVFDPAPKIENYPVFDPPPPSDDKVVFFPSFWGLMKNMWKTTWKSLFKNRKNSLLLENRIEVNQSASMNEHEDMEDFELHSDAYILEKEEIENILSDVMEVAIELDYLDEKIINSSISLNGLDNRDKLIELMNELKTKKNELLNRLEEAYERSELFYWEKDQLERIAGVVELYEYEDIIEDPSSILSNITDLGMVSSIEEFENLIDNLMENYFQYIVEYNKFLEQYDKSSKEVNMEKLVSIVSRTIKDWLKLDRLNADEIFKGRLSEESRKKLDTLNMSYRRFLDRLYKTFMNPSIEKRKEGSLRHARFNVAMLLSSEKEREFLKLWNLMYLYHENSVPIPDHVDNFLNQYSVKTMEVLRSLENYIDFNGKR